MLEMPSGIVRMENAAFAKTRELIKGNSMLSTFDLKLGLAKKKIIQDIGGLLMNGAIYYTLVNHVTRSINKINFHFLIEKEPGSHK